jgi:hypothetical protein
MQTLLIIIWIIAIVFGVASWLVCGLWIEGTPRNPRFSLSFMGQYWSYRRARKAAWAEGHKPAVLKWFEWLFTASLASFILAMLLAIVTAATK